MNYPGKMKKMNWLQKLVVNEITFFGDYAEVNHQWKTFITDKADTIFLVRYDWSKSFKDDKVHELRFLYVPNNLITRMMGFSVVNYPFSLHFKKYA